MVLGGLGDTENELLEAAVQHAVVHNHPDSPDLRDQIKHAMRDGTPPGWTWPSR